MESGGKNFNISGSVDACAALFKANPLPMVFMRINDREIIEANDAFVRNYGKLQDFSPDILPISDDLLQKGFIQNCETVIVAADGKKRIVIISAEIVTINSDTFIFVVIQDITERKEIENALLQSEAKLSSIINSIPNPIFYKDINLCYAGCNNAFVEYLGIPKERIIGSTVYDVAPPDLAVIYDKADKNLISSGMPQQYEAIVKYADGSMRSVMFSKSVVVDADGKKAGIVGVMLDITERKQTEDALKLFHALLDQSGDSIFVINPDSGRILDANKTACKTLDYSIDELKKLHTYELDICLGTPESRIPLAQRVKKEGDVTIDGIFKTNGGRMILAEVSIRFVEVGGIAYHVASARDVTEKRRSEERIRNSEARYRMLIENSSDIIYSLNPDGSFSYVSNGVRKLGYEPDEIIGRHISDFIDEHDQAATLKAFQESITSNIVDKLTFKVKCKDGSLVDLEESGQTVRTPEGRVIQVVGILRDVTRRLRDDAAKIREEKLKAVMEAAGAACHELNQPLQAVIGYVDIITHQRTGKSVDSTMIDKISVQLKRMAEITRKLNTITRYEVREYVGDSKIIDLDKSAQGGSGCRNE